VCVQSVVGVDGGTEAADDGVCLYELCVYRVLSELMVELRQQMMVSVCMNCVCTECCRS